ncbi:MAG: PEP-CTERM sorting domain-containing protein [Bryobacteraceae bacterium]|nr:PEP-CTERM sorting domain-containing protein [Bryobacteraceae bacterium]
MTHFILIVLSVFLLSASPAHAGAIFATSNIEGGAAHLQSGGAYQSGGSFTSVTMLGADPGNSLFTVSASAMGFARLGELSVQTVAVASGSSAGPGAIRSTAAASYQDTMTVTAPGLEGTTGYLIMLIPDPPAGGMHQVVNGAYTAQACTGLCTGDPLMFAIAPGYSQIGRLPFVFGEAFDYTVALSVWSAASWTAGQQQYAYAGVATSLEATGILIGFANWEGHGVNGLVWNSRGGLEYREAPAHLVHNPEPGTWALLGAGLAALGWIRRRMRPSA